jgi:hypothetical protein
MLYDEQTATDEMKKQKAEVDRLKERLQAHPFVKIPIVGHKEAGS